MGIVEAGLNVLAAVGAVLAVVGLVLIVNGLVSSRREGAAPGRTTTPSTP